MGPRRSVAAEASKPGIAEMIELRLGKRRLERGLLIGDHIELGLLQNHLNIVAAGAADERSGQLRRQWTPGIAGVRSPTSYG